MSDTDEQKGFSAKYRIFRFLARAALLFVYLLIRVLPLRIHKSIANAAGLALHKFVPRNRKLVVKHLEMAYGDELSPVEIQDIALRCNRHMAMNIFEFIRFPSMSSKEILRRVTFEGEENIKEALALNKGVIALSGHYGNWELLGAALVARGYSLTVVRRDQNDGLINDVIQKQREKKGIKTVPRDKPIFKQIISLLNGNEIVALIADQNAAEGIFVDFFGRPASTFKGPALFASITGAPIVPIFIIREDYMKHRVVFRPAIEVQTTGDRDRDALAVTQACAKEIELVIRLHPEQWMWQHKRWKTQQQEA
jgi:KDO2-lipid IV(A) lauroyltransferase